MTDPRFYSAAALIIIGLVLCGFVIRVWLTNPINRVFIVGPYVTETGLKMLLQNLPTGFALGLFALAAGLAKVGYAARWQGYSGGELADFLGLVEAIFAVWAACCVVVAAWRLCRKG